MLAGARGEGGESGLYAEGEAEVVYAEHNSSDSNLFNVATGVSGTVEGLRAITSDGVAFLLLCCCCCCCCPGGTILAAYDVGGLELEAAATEEERADSTLLMELLRRL